MPDTGRPAARARKSHPRSRPASPALTGAAPSRGADLAFVAYQAGASSGVSTEARKTVRREAAKASAATRKATIAWRAANQKSRSSSEGTESPYLQVSDSRRPSTSGDETSPLPSPAPSISLSSLPRIPSPAPSISPSVSIPQTLSAAPPLYPTDIWHPLIPEIVDYFLRYFAPPPDRGRDQRGRELLSTRLWSQALRSPALFHATLLVAGSHAYVAGALAVPVAFLAQLKHSALEGINDGIAMADSDGGVSDAVIGAIALFGGWELEYGSFGMYDTHMRGLQTIVRIRGGLYPSSPQAPKQPPPERVIVDIVMDVGHNCASYASAEPYFSAPHILTSGHHSRDHISQAGLQALREQRLEPPHLLHLGTRLHQASLDPSQNGPELQAIGNALLSWDENRVFSTKYSSLQTKLEDDMNFQSHQHILIALLAIYGSVIAAQGTDAKEALDVLRAEVPLLQTDTLLLTVYEEMAFWSLTTICAATGKCDAQQMRVLKRLQTDLQLSTYHQFRLVLDRYTFPNSVLSERVEALWEAIKSSTISRDAFAGSLTQPSRYARGVQHPTLHVGAAIAALEDEVEAHSRCV